MVHKGPEKSRIRRKRADMARADERRRLAEAVADREGRGQLVREVWVEWAAALPDPKDSWLLPWSRLDPGQREVDMRIGTVLTGAERERIRVGLATIAERYAGTPDRRFGEFALGALNEVAALLDAGQ